MSYFAVARRPPSGPLGAARRSGGPFREPLRGCVGPLKQAEILAPQNAASGLRGQAHRQSSVRYKISRDGLKVDQIDERLYDYLSSTMSGGYPNHD